MPIRPTRWSVPASSQGQLLYSRAALHDNNNMRIGGCKLLPAILLMLCGTIAYAGGSGLRAVVIVNNQSSNSVALGNYYCEMRQVPPENLVRINWTGGNTSWTPQQYTNTLLLPLYSALRERRLTNQADFLLLSMDIPYKIESGVHTNSTTSALFYGFKLNDAPPASNLPNSCSLPASTKSDYAGSESLFRAESPGAQSRSNLLATMITASNLPLAQATVLQSILADSTFPDAPVYIVKSPNDPARNIRYLTAHNAILDARLQNRRSIIITNKDGAPPSVPQISGAQTGWQNYNPFVTTYVPGALVDNLTSVGGRLFLPNDHLTLIEILRAGATGTYGTVDEPCAYLQKFPSPHLFFYQNRGFTLAECYYLSVTNPYQGLILGDPLSAPYSRPPNGRWTTLPATPLAGTATLGFLAQAADPSLPVARVDLFVDGLWHRTLTNIAPARYNTVTVTIDGVATSYTVPASANLDTVANGLASALNTPARMSQTKTRATPVGDRIQLSRTNGFLPGSITVSTAQGAAGSLTTFATLAQPNFIESTACGMRQCAVESSGSSLGNYISCTITKTNGLAYTLSATNSSTNLAPVLQSLATSINTHPDLTGPDGVIVEDIINFGSRVIFNLRARSPGYPASRLKAKLTSDLTSYSPETTLPLDDPIADVLPRNHIYITSGRADLPVSFSIDTTQLPNGPREFTAIVMDGTHVRAHRAANTNLYVQNGSLTATLQTLVGGSNTALRATLQFRMAASGATISRLDLYGTGGLLATSTSPQATFSIPAAQLGLGLHPIYGIAIAGTGQKFRTAPIYIRIIDYTPSFALTASTDPGLISWPSSPGLTYTILASTNLTQPFLPVGTLSPTNDTATWQPIPPASATSFYRVRAEP